MFMQNPMISIIVPCFNNERYIEKCLKSIVDQSYKDFEVIIINDGSTDNSKTIIEKLIKKRQNFHLLNQKNMGVSTARNKGLEFAKGKYVCFVDADDYIEKDYLKLLLSSLEKTQSELCLCSVIHEDLNGNIIFVDKLKKCVLSNMETANLKNLIWGYACNKLYKMEIIRKNNIVFEKDIKFAEDELFYLTYLFTIKQVCMIDDCLYHYVRQRKSATKDTTNMSVQINRFDSRRRIIELLSKNKVNQYVINKHIIACIDTCLLVMAYKFKDQKLSKEQKSIYLRYIKDNKKIYLEDKSINWKAKFFLRLACLCLPIYVPTRRFQLKVTKRI